MNPHVDNLPQRRLISPKKKSGRKAVATKPSPPRSPMFVKPSSSDATSSMTMSKPMRPLAAYHIFFQIEREYIIQTASPDHVVSDPTKTYQADVPSRYRSIKLSPDWYAGPGKRQKRKHRKTHGMIGFLELSRVISQRWAILETVDPETKEYVTQVAAREMVEFKEELEQYELLMAGDVMSNMSNNCTKRPVKTKKTRTNITAAIAPLSNDNIDTVPSSLTEKMTPACLTNGGVGGYSSDAPGDIKIKSEADLYASPPVNNAYSEVDYSIATVSNNGHYMPSFGLFNDSVDSVTFDVSHPDVDELSADPLLDWECNDSEDVDPVFNFVQSLKTNTPKEMNDGMIDHDDDFLDFMSLSAEDERYLTVITDDDDDTVVPRVGSTLSEW